MRWHLLCGSISHKCKIDMMKTIVPRFLLLFSMFCGLAGCQEDEYVAGTTSFSLKLTDAPAAYQEVQLHIKEVQVETPSETFTIPVTTAAFNVLDLRMGKSLVLVDDFELSSERIQALRLVFHETENTVRTDSVEHQLTMPEQTNGVWEIEMTEDLKPGIPFTMVLDFDAARSVTFNQDEEQYMLKPVIRAFSESVSGVVRGHVTPELAMPTLYLLSEGDTLAGTLATQQGEFYFPGVPDGNYQLEVVSGQPVYEDLRLDDIALTAGETVDLTIELTERDSIPDATR